MRTSTRVIRTLAELERLEPEWQDLAGSGTTPMQQFAWVQCCARHLPGDPFVVVHGEPGALRAAAPLVLTSGPFPRLEVLGAEWMHEATDFLYAEPADLEPIADALLDAGFPLFLRRLPADSPAVAALTAAGRRRGIAVCQEASGAPWIPLDAGWENPETHLNSGRRSDLRRARRHAAEAGAVAVEIRAPRPAELAPLLDEAFRVESESWKGRAGSALTRDPVVGDFFRAYAHSAAAAGNLRVCFLRIAGSPAAMQIAIEWDRRFWLHKIGYDERYARCSPGTLLMLETLRHAARTGLRSYEFLGETEAWTRIWTDAVHPTATLSVYPAKPLGLARLAGDLPRLVYREVRGLARRRAP